MKMLFLLVMSAAVGEGAVVRSLQKNTTISSFSSSSKTAAAVPIAEHDRQLEALAVQLRWMTDNGASVEKGKFQAESTHHGGATIRGIVSKEDLPSKENLLVIPRKLWLVLDNFPEFKDAQLDDLAECKPLSKVNLRLLQLSAAVAKEARMGGESFYQPYLSTLPTLGDFRSFHPRFISTSVARDFQGLPQVNIAMLQRKADFALRACFEAWKASSPTSPVAGLSWDTHMLLGLAWHRTRAYNVGDSPALIPGADLFNTGPKNTLNTKWIASKDVFTVQTMTPLHARDELLDSYCVSCSNDKMLGIWGVYLEDNQNVLHHDDSLVCSRSLRSVVEANLDMQEAAIHEALAEHWTAPRCHAAAFANPDQGPLRCAFSRLSWENCADKWGYRVTARPKHAKGANKLAFLQERPVRGLSSTAEQAELFDRSLRHSVPDALLSSIEAAAPFLT